MNSEDEDNDSAFTITKMKLRSIMPQGEMELLMTFFPKAAQTLASVLRNRSHEP
jgi:hypothetical protein